MKGILLVCVVAVACGKGKGKADIDPDEQPAIDFVVKGAREDLPLIKAAIASKRPLDGMFKCSSIANLDALKKGDDKVAAEIEQLCAHDLWATQIKISVEAAEQARKAKPTENPLSECYSADLAMSQDELTKANKLDEPTKALIARFKVACPPVK